MAGLVCGGITHLVGIDAIIGFAMQRIVLIYNIERPAVSELWRD